MAKMEIECGTYKVTKFEIEVDNYAAKFVTEFDPEKYKQAFDLLRNTMDDYTFIDDGCRNEDAVNSCIALHVLGYDPEEWFENFFESENQDNKFLEYDINKFMEHVERVCGYLHRWGPQGHETNALNYAI